jgi:kynureninase
MEYQNTLDFALKLDSQDPLKDFRSKFLLPKHEGKDAIYLCGNSLGLQPVSAQRYLSEQLSVWQDLGVEGWFNAKDTWLSYCRSQKRGSYRNEFAYSKSSFINGKFL